MAGLSLLRLINKVPYRQSAIAHTGETAIYKES